MAHKNVFAVVLSGCGVNDGSEIHEATLVMYAIKKMGADYDVFAPDMPLHHVINHQTGQVETGSRDVISESARIARGKVRPLNEYKASAYSGIVFPGGYGVAKNLSTYAFDGADCKILPEVEKAIKETAKLQKPIGAMCISPVLIAKVLGNVTLTVGSDPESAGNVEKMGAKHILTTEAQVVVDPINKIVSTPCYMLDSTIDQIGDSAMNLVREMIKML